MKEAEALQIFLDTGALVDGHFLLSSGLHAGRYVAKELVYPHTTKLNSLCGAVADRFRYDDIEAVVSPVVGGVALSQWTANHLTRMKGQEVQAFWVEKTSFKSFALLRRYAQLVAGKKVLIVDDVLTTGHSVEAVRRAVESCGASVMGIGVLWLRGEINLIMPKFFSLINCRFPVWKASECPLCAQGIPINTDFGRGKDSV